MHILKLHRARQRAPWRPQWTLVLAFLATILAGALLLALPMAGAGGRPVPFTDALFTATSATCVTGLSVVDIGTRFSRAGQIVIMLLFQIGGVGIMTFATFMLVMLGRRLSVRSESVLATSIGQGETIGILPLLRGTVLFSSVIEGLGALVLAWRHWEAGYTPARALYYGVFHAVSAFCNAGFSLYPSGLQAVYTDAGYVLTIASLIVLGGLGFLVLHNLSQYRFWRRDRHTRGRVNAHTRMVLQMSLVLTLIGTVLFALLEWNHALAGRSLADKGIGALFHAISSRTAGFNLIEMTRQIEATRLLTIGLMFIGGSPGSTAGGIKTTTLLVLVLTIRAIIRGRQTTLYGVRAIPETIVREAITIFLLGLAFVGVVFGLLLLVEAPAPGGAAALPLLFEAVSAFGTAGLSLDLTPLISPAGRWLLMLAMFVGRLGPLTIVMIVGSAGRSEAIHYPEEEVVVG
ncbi:MAG: hypothetical protein GX590_03265 [Lentisphaerae bacterium]|nr:hypothetical protein [Lentisphaerota bacterium]